MRRWMVAVAVGLAVVIGGVAGGLIVWGTESSSSGNANACNAVSIAYNDLPSIVTIAARSGQAGGTGSGEIIRSSGYILTNNHVISPAANGGSVEVLFSNGTTAPATITGRDPQTDIAVIKVNGQSNLRVISLGSSSSVQVGAPVVALGAPLGLSSTVTAGIVSANDRTVDVPADNGQTALLVSAIQTDASINPGNSGGALTNCAGQLIGMPTAGATVPNERGQSSAGSVGIGFAIPVDFAIRVANELISTGSVTHSDFGIQVAQVPAAAAQQAGTSEGIFVSAVTAGGPSAAAGLRQGDIITQLNGQTATDPNQLAELTLTQRPGDRVPMTYLRGGQSHQVTVTLAAQRRA